MKNILLKPYPLQGQWSALLRDALGASIIVSAFLAIFQPFGFNSLSGNWPAFVGAALGYGGVCLLSLVLLGGLQVMLYDALETRWTIGLEWIRGFLSFFLIGLGNMLFSAYIFEESISWDYFLRWMGITLAVGLVPTIMGSLWTQTRLQRKYDLGAQQMGSPPPLPTPQTAQLSLRGDNQGEELTLSPNALLYVEAADNYVKAVFMEKEAPRSLLLRASLKKIETQLLDFPQFYRCHRRFLVNMECVGKVSGNAQGYRLHLPNGDEIPVSRSLNEELPQRMTTRRGV